MQTLVDVRRFPGSRRHPQFGQTALFRSLEEAGIRAVWREGLGGRREAVPGQREYGVEERELSRDMRTICRRQRFVAEIDWLMALAEFDRGGDVRGGGAVAVPSVVDWGCGAGSRAGGGGHLCGGGWEELAAAACDDGVCAGGGWAGVVSGGAGVVLIWELRKTSRWQGGSCEGELTGDEKR